MFENFERVSQVQEAEEIMIYTSYFAKVRNLPENIVPIAVCAIVPQWWKGLSYKRIAPPKSLVLSYKQNLDKEHYQQLYTKQVLDKTAPKIVLRELFKLLPRDFQNKLSSHDWWCNSQYHILLLCYEKPEDFCHRHLFAEWMTESGYEIREWKYE